MDGTVPVASMDSLTEGGKSTHEWSMDGQISEGGH